MERALTVDKEVHLTFEPRTSGLLKAVHEKIRTIATSDETEMVPEDLSTTDIVASVRHTVKRLTNIFRILRRCGLDALGAEELAAVLETSLRVSSVFELLRSLDPSTSSTGSVEEVAAQLNSVATATYETLGLIIAKTFCLGDYFNSQVDGAGEHFTRLLDISKEAKDTLSDIQRIARYEITGKFGDIFDAEAAKLSKAAWGWTIGTAVVGVIGAAYLLYAVHAVEPLTTSLPVAKIFAIEVGNLTIASFIFYLMTFCAKYAASYRHNEVLNVQRRNALRAVNIVVDAAPTEAFKDNILVQAAQAAFETTSTGFGSVTR